MAKQTYTDKLIKAKLKRIRKIMDAQDDRIHDMIINPKKYQSNKYNGFLNLIEDGKEER